jgi:hypothetical protein
MELLKDKVAINCGASPGGWTKYLMEQGCRRVYCIDPRSLDESISRIENVHYHMVYQEALPSLATQGIQCDVLFSDMCLHVLDHTSDLLREATPLMRSGALVVMPLKCIAGYSHASYNGQVADHLCRGRGLRGNENDACCRSIKSSNCNYIIHSNCKIDTLIKARLES